MTARGLREEEGREGGIEQKGGLGERGGGGLQGDWELFLPSVGLQTLMCKCVCFGNFQE